MKHALICWKNLPYKRKTLIVRHAESPFSSGVAWGDCLVVIGEDDIVSDEYGQVLMTEIVRQKRSFSGVGMSVQTLPVLDDGDIVRYDEASCRLEVVFEVNSKTNSLYVTNACNSRCQFCPQPSTSDDGSLYDAAMDVIRLVDNAGEQVNVTGGEPTLSRSRMLSLLEYAANKWKAPVTSLIFYRFSLKQHPASFDAGCADDYGLRLSPVEEIFKVRSADSISFGIPLYADSAVVHDSIVGVSGAYSQTIKGLYNLACMRAEIEVRFVVSRLSYKRLPRLVEFVGRNLPFINRIAVMGIEPTGYCRERWTDFWIDPEDSAEELSTAAAVADNYNITLFLYNMQLCCLPSALRKIACLSISEWKRVYVSKCDACPMRNSCGGFFASQDEMQFLPRRFHA